MLQLLLLLLLMPLILLPQFLPLVLNLLLLLSRRRSNSNRRSSRRSSLSKSLDSNRDSRLRSIAALISGDYSVGSSALDDDHLRLADNSATFTRLHHWGQSFLLNEFLVVGDADETVPVIRRTELCCRSSECVCLSDPRAGLVSSRESGTGCLL